MVDCLRKGPHSCSFIGSVGKRIYTHQSHSQTVDESRPSVDAVCLVTLHRSSRVHRRHPRASRTPSQLQLPDDSITGVIAPGTYRAALVLLTRLIAASASTAVAVAVSGMALRAASMLSLSLVSRSSVSRAAVNTDLGDSSTSSFCGS